MIENDVWTEDSIEFPCDTCGDRTWYLFLQDDILYGDCASCERQQVILDKS